MAARRLSRSRTRAAAVFLSLLLPACGGSGTKVDARATSDATSGSDLARADGDAAFDSDAATDAPSATGDDAAVDRVDGGDDTSADLRVDAASDAPPIEAGVDAAPPPASGSPYRALAISTGTAHACALLDNHRIKCWGDNSYGVLGTGDTRARGAAASEMGNALPFVDLGTGRTALAVAAGRNHTCAILDDGSVKCWGLAAWTGVPVASTVMSLGDEPGEMGDHLPALALGAGRKARLLASGFVISCAILDDDSARCWGEDQSWLLPKPVDLGTTRKIVQLAPGGNGVVALFDDGLVSSILPYGNGSAWSPPKATSISGSPTNICAVLATGAISCSNVGSGSWTTPSDLVASWVGEEGVCGLFAGGGVRCVGSIPSCDDRAPGATYWCGPRQPDQSFAVMLGRPAVALPPGGYYHACALLDDGSVRCWATSENCTFNNGTLVSCPVPQQKDLDPSLGASVDVVTTANGPRYGAWNAIDLGTHP